MKTAQRKAFSWKIVAIGLVGLLVLAAAIGAFGYFRYLRYERVAALHLPDDTIAAVRIDVEKVVLFEPVRKHLLPLSNELGSPDGVQGARMQRLKDKSGVELRADLRELVLARGPFPGQWLLAIGGRFPKQGVVDGLAEVLRDEGQVVSRLADDQLELATGVGIGQAEDGTVVVAESVARMRSGLPSQSTHEKLRLPREGPGAFAVQGRLLRPLVALSVTAAPALRDIAHIESIHGVLGLGDNVTIETLLLMSTAAGTAGLEERGRALVRALAQLSRLLIPGAEPSTLERARVTLAEPRTLRVVFALEREEVDRIAQALAAAIRHTSGAQRPTR